MQAILYVLLILFGIPVGKILSSLCRGEVSLWRKRFRIIALVCFLLIGLFLFLDFENKIPVFVSLLFVVFVSLNIK
ncbi:hypothetical protein HOE04_03415 [archaeon]|jgi:hypothetical protein|nr:hypothetical protein [archaeon]